MEGASLLGSPDENPILTPFLILQLSITLRLALIDSSCHSQKVSTTSSYLPLICLVPGERPQLVADSPKGEIEHRSRESSLQPAVRMRVTPCDRLALVDSRYRHSSMVRVARKGPTRLAAQPALCRRASTPEMGEEWPFVIQS